MQKQSLRLIRAERAMGIIITKSYINIAKRFVILLNLLHFTYFFWIFFYTLTQKPICSKLSR